MGQKVLRCKTIAEREIQLVKGLVAISQALKKREGEERGRRFYGLFYLFISPLSRGGSPPPSASPRLPPGTSLDMAF